MKIWMRNWAVVSAAWVAFALVGRAAYADEPIKCEKRLPQNVLGYVSLRNVADFKTQWPKTLLGQLERDESLKEFRSEVIKQLAEPSQQLEEHLGLSLSDLAAIPQGEIALAAVAAPGGKMSAVLFIDFGDREETVQKLVTKAADAIEKNGLKRSEEEVEETRVVVFQNTGEEGDRKQAEAGAYFLKDSFLVLGSDLAVLKSVLTRWDGKNDRVLAENEVFRYIVDKCRDENSDAPPALTWFIDPVALVEAAGAAAAGEARGGAPVQNLLATLPNLGIDKLRGIGGTFDLAHGDYDMISRTLVCMDRPAKGVLNLVQFDVGPQAPPKWLTSDWSGYTALKWNLEKAYTAVEGLVDMQAGPGVLAGLIQNLADNEMSGKVHLKKDVLDQLTGTFHFAEPETVAKSDDANRFLVAAELKNVALFRATLGKLARIPGLKIDVREFQGETIYEIPTGGGADEEEGGDGKPAAIAVAVAEKHLLVASEVRLLERVLRGAGNRETLADSAAFQRIARKFPDQTASINYRRQDSQFKLLYDLLQAGHAGMFLGGPLASFDFSKLPDIESLKKYMPASGGFMEHDERGLKITSFSLRNETD